MHPPPIRILHLITSLGVGGAETMLLKLVRQMDEGDFLSHVVCMTSEGAVGDRIIQNGIPVTYLRMPRGRLTFRGVKRLMQVIKHFRPDILQSWLYHSDLVGLLIGRMLMVKTILWNLRCAYIDLNRYRVATGIVLKLCRLLSSFADGIVSNSGEAIRYHKAMGYRNGSWYLIPNGVDPSRFAPNPHAKTRLLKELGEGLDLNFGGRHLETELQLIGCVARFDPMKDYKTLIEAAKVILYEYGQVVFVLVGRDVEWQNSFFQNAIPDKLRSRFFLLGERSDVADILAALDIFLLTSYGEGFPNVLCEAMAAGVPCIATDVGDCRRVVADTGLIVQPKNPQQISDAIKTLALAPSQERRQLGQRARQRVMKHYTIEAVTQRYETLYKSFKQHL